jgi:hypothetical protein
MNSGTIVEIAGAGIHPAQADQTGLVVAGDLVEEFGADVAVNHMLHVIGVAEQKRQIEDIEVPAV